MKIINATERYEKTPDEVACFLTGGTGNTQWIESFMRALRLEDNRKEIEKLVVYNPYNPWIKNLANQIIWEYQYLNKYIFDTNNENFIFSIYFDEYTVQPISLFELGKILGIVSNGENINHNKIKLVLSAEAKYEKLEEIQIHCALCGYSLEIRTPEEHAREVVRMYKLIMGEDYKDVYTEGRR